MKTVLLHGLGQTAQDWKEVVQQLSISDVDCPELFSSAEDEISYSQILGDLEQRYSEVKEPVSYTHLTSVICWKNTAKSRDGRLWQSIRTMASQAVSYTHLAVIFRSHGLLQIIQGTLRFPCAGCRQLPFCGLAARKHLALQAVPVQQVLSVELSLSTVI